MEYIISHQLSDNKYRYIHSKTGKITISSTLPNIDRRYQQQRGKTTEEDLIEYAKNFKQWVREMKSTKGYRINYLNYYLDSYATYNIFHMLSDINLKDMTPVSSEEYEWISKCSNSAIQYCKPGEYQSYGYDFKNNYPRNMISSDFHFPIRPGRSIKCMKIADNIRWGYYMVKIESNDDDVKKLFTFSKHNVYTKTSLDYAIKLMEMGYDITIKLDTKLEKNAYIYDKADMINGNKVFKRWYSKLSFIKKEFPKNVLIKSIMSQLWGVLCRYNEKSYNTVNDIEKNNMWDDISMTNKTKYYIIDHIEDDDDKKDYYLLRDNEHPMKYPLGRIKPWITAYGRNKIANVCLHDIDNVVRVQTDGVCFKKKQNFGKKYVTLIPEDKTTGLIEWANVNKWYNKKTGDKYGRW